MKNLIYQDPPEGGKSFKKILTIGLCSCVSFSIYASSVGENGPHPPTGKQPALASVTQEGFKVKGQVVDEVGPLPGVNIMIKGTMTGVVTDMDGNFEITAPYSGASLVFSYIGYQSLEIELKGRHELTITMVEDSKALEEVVVVGYTTQKKATITGSVSTITTKDLKQSPTANLNNALAGRMPGLMANQFGGGEPGVDRAELRIRGMGTYGDKSPTCYSRWRRTRYELPRTRRNRNLYYFKGCVCHSTLWCPWSKWCYHYYDQTR